MSIISSCRTVSSSRRESRSTAALKKTDSDSEEDEAECKEYSRSAVAPGGTTDSFNSKSSSSSYHGSSNSLSPAASDDHSRLLLDVDLEDNYDHSLIYQEQNESLLRAFYNALAAGNVVLVKALLAPDLELWFHGPRCHQYMSKLLTGSTSFRSVSLIPASIHANRDRVFVEGRGPAPSRAAASGVSWAHIWTVEQGRLVALREYWATAVLVSRSSSLQRQFTADYCKPVQSRQVLPPSQLVWQSKLWETKHPCTPALIVLIWITTPVRRYLILKCALLRIYFASSLLFLKSAILLCFASRRLNASTIRDLVFLFLKPYCYISDFFYDSWFRVLESPLKIRLLHSYIIS